MRERLRSLPALLRRLARMVWQSRVLELMWPALIFLIVDLCLRREIWKLKPATGLFAYAQVWLAGALVWGGFGALLGMALRRVGRSGLDVLWGLLALVAATACVLLGGLGAGQTIWFGLSRSYADLTLVRGAWSMRAAMASYLRSTELHRLPAVWLTALGALLFFFHARRRTLPGLSPLVTVGCVAAAFAGATPILVTSARLSWAPEWCPPESGGLSLVVQGVFTASPEDKGPHHKASLRSPRAVPPVEHAGPQRNVLLVLTESIRADELCSDPRMGCQDQYLDPVLPERIGLSHLRSQAPATFTSCMVLWTGLDPDTQYPDSHQAPLLWEVARAAGYRTAYISAQHFGFNSFGSYVTVAGIDKTMHARDFQRKPDIWTGAPDEKAMDAMLKYARETKGPWYGVLHLSNTHSPYRSDTSFRPFLPDSGSDKDFPGFRNHYRNAIALQTSHLAEFFRDLKQTPEWDRTVVVFLADHGEPFNDHGALYHGNSFFEEEMRVPGWIVAGPHALSDEERANVESNRDRWVYARDVHATLMDAIGYWDDRERIPYSERRAGRSLLRPLGADEPIAVFANISGVWGLARPRFGAARGGKKVVSRNGDPFQCFDYDLDPKESSPRPADACGADLVQFAQARFPNVRRK